LTNVTTAGAQTGTVEVSLSDTSTSSAADAAPPSPENSRFNSAASSAEAGPPPFLEASKVEDRPARASEPLSTAPFLENSRVEYPGGITPSESLQIAAAQTAPPSIPGFHTIARAVEATPTSWPPPSATLEAPVPAAVASETPHVIPADAPVAGFDSLGLSPELLKAVAAAGYTVPTPIQAEGIPHVMKRRDIVGIAQTGTGKTASFTLPMIELLSRGRAKARMPRSLILEPTRELAAQVAESFEKYGKYNKLSMALLIGGVSFDDQDRKLDRGVDVLIATPGRLLDHFERGKLMLSQVQILVIDEADRMLDMGFIPDVERICKLIPFTRQTLFYSATMPPEIRRLTDQFLQNPVRVEVARPATTADNIRQEIIDVPNNEWAKREALRRLIREAGEITNAIVFCNRKRDVDIVAKSLSKHGFNAAPLHGDLDQSVRTRTLDGFRSGEVTVLVASDVAARGLDIPATSHIFNFDVPYHPDDYVHRIGRTGRAGRGGTALMLATSRDGKYVEAIERLTKATLPHRKLEGLAEASDARPPRDDRHSRDRHGRDRGRGRERDHRDRPVKPHGQVAAMEPIKMDSTHSARRPQEPKQHQPQKQQAPRPPKPQQQPKQHQPREPKQPDPQQLPAFLLRPVNLPKAPEKPVRTAKKENTDS
jgi:superfamily II DNA/RNA helicase